MFTIALIRVCANLLRVLMKIDNAAAVHGAAGYSDRPGISSFESD
jgi:hypothetical protein